MIEFIEQRNFNEMIAVLFSAMVFVSVLLIAWYFFRVQKGSKKKSEGSSRSPNGTLPYSTTILSRSHPPENYLTTSFGDVYIRLSGIDNVQAPWVILMHGWGASGLVWRFIEIPLSKYFRVLNLDLPGFGRSESSQILTFSMDEQCKRLLEIFDLSKIQTAFLVGNSMGGALALWLGKQFPERFSRLVAINPAVSSRLIPIKIYNPRIMGNLLRIGFNRYSLKWIYSRVVQNQDLLTDEYLKQVYDSYKNSPRIFTSLISATSTIQDARMPQDLKGMKSSVLVLYGEKDRVVPRWAIDDLMNVIPEAALKLHPQGGHHLMEDEPLWVLDCLTKFLKI